MNAKKSCHLTRGFSTILFFTAFLIGQVGLVILTLDRHSMFFYLKMKIHTFKDIYVVSIVNTPNWIRSINLWNMWGKEFIKNCPQCQFKFVSNAYNSNFSDILLLSTNQLYSRDFLEYFYVAVKDFINNAQYEWIYRTTEDCLVDIQGFSSYLRNLLMNYNSSQLVIKGHSVQYCPTNYFIHGGNGWIMSRAAAQKFLDNIEIVKQHQSKAPSIGDDVIVGWFAQEILQLSFSDTDDPYFLGSPYSDEEIEIVKEKGWDQLPQCSKKCIDKQKPIKDIVFWHSGRADNYPMNIGISAKDVYPSNVYYDQNSNPRRLCISRLNQGEHN